MTRTGTLAEYAVLGLLSRGERSGYDVNRLAQQSTGMLIAPTKSRIYAVLPRLVEADLVTRRRVTQAARPDKTLYRLTRQGRRALVEWLNEVPDVITRQELGLKLFFGEYADPERLLEQLDLYRELNVRELELLQRFEREVDDASDRAVFSRITIDLGLAIDRALIRWIDRSRAALEQLRSGA